MQQPGQNPATNKGKAWYCSRKQRGLCHAHGLPCSLLAIADAFMVLGVSLEYKSPASPWVIHVVFFYVLWKIALFRSNLGVKRNMTLMLKLLIIQCIVKGTLKEIQKIIREIEAPLAVTEWGLLSSTTGLLGHFWHNIHPSESSSHSKNGPCFAIFQSTSGRKEIQTPENTSGGTKNNETTINIFSNESPITLPTLKMSPQPEQMSITWLQRSLHALAEQTFAVMFSTHQSNPQRSVASAQRSEATFPNSLNRAVAKLKRNPKPQIPVQRSRYWPTCSTQFQRVDRDS